MSDAAAVIERIKRQKIIAILRGVPESKLGFIAEALVKGGVRAIECTFDHARADCVALNGRMIAQLAQIAGEDMDIGAGTVLTPEEARATAEAGGRFIVSPNVSAQVIGETVRLGLVSIPGAFTPTEIVSAWEAGAHFVKLFPASQMGAPYIKAVRAPLSHIPLLAVGGVTPENVRELLDAGVCGFGVGSPLLPKAVIEANNWAAVTERARRFMEAVSHH
ncbi:MAG: bifunctional 4-hydroxy-2-oxoglutarate aldolase/2-dehydro-3-deoxy-phosphogluconate aldolase [Clostridia bacterium]|nr:bifunctional 4-hydroxy-2-oxoglutarate aldolase/2-dehydro-3-deoxy-phosphogluconate aldolase [Clostridia bacterium]